MAQTVREVMAEDLQTLSRGDSITAAARAMRDADVGDVLVLHDDGTLCGIVTDRDIAVRAVAEGRDPESTTVIDICSREVVALAPDEDVEEAANTMRQRAVRRLPVVEGENGRPIGIVSIGDLAIERDPDSGLADVSAARGNE